MKDINIFDRENMKRATELADYDGLHVMEHLSIIMKGSETLHISMVEILDSLIRTNHGDEPQRSLFMILKIVCFLIKENDLDEKDIPARITIEWLDMQVLRYSLNQPNTLPGVN